jgi:phospholipid transport system substrate-binding protein
MRYLSLALAGVVGFGSFAAVSSANAFQGMSGAGYAVSTTAYWQVVSLKEGQLDEAEKFVSKLADSAIGFLSDASLAPEKKASSFKQLLQTHFDMKSIGRFALGRYWRVATPAQQEEYLGLFNDMIVEVYSRRFSEYKGQILTVTGSRIEGENDAIVTSVVKQDDGPDIAVDWRIRHSSNGYKVIDVIVEGVSMALTQRSDFASVIQRGGGDVSVLLTHIKSTQ